MRTCSATFLAARRDRLQDRCSSPRTDWSIRMPRYITFGVILTGTGGPGEHNRWLDPEIPGDASVDIDWYIEQAQAAEAAALDLVFIVDSQFITDWKSTRLNSSH